MVFWLALLCPVLSTSLAGFSLPSLTLANAMQSREVPREYQLKAIYLYNFLNFVYWPLEKCDPPGVMPREIAVIGHSPFGDALQALKHKLHKAGTPLDVIYLGSYHKGMDLSGCRLLFVCDSEKQNFETIIASVAGKPVLTVGDSEEFVEAGGMITLISRQNKVRWIINRMHTREAGLQMKAKLLDIAVKVVE
ncbi:MAG: YfiR family protein [Proteobacteria bacterium]|nr:YfiR family protein [Pseudomonadota bacterium]MBU1687694.1 YfiR family protein [Pseudomonadota bacterium]